MKTPKEKALELVNSFIDLDLVEVHYELPDGTYSGTKSRQCALVSVNGWINVLRHIPASIPQEAADIINQLITEALEVKAEIEKL